MTGFSNLDSSLRMTSNQIETFSKQNPKKLPQEAVKEITSNAMEVGNKLAKLARQPGSGALDSKVIDQMVANISTMRKRASEEAPKELNKMFEALEFLQEQLQHYNSQQTSSLTKMGKRVKIDLDKDLDKHLAIANKGLSQLRKAFQQEKVVSDGDYQDLEEILIKTDDAMVKQMAFHKTFAKQSVPEHTLTVIGKILEDIKFLHHNISAQVRAGTARVQASSFRTTLRKIKDRLLALQKLNKTRGLMAAQVEQDTQS